MSYSGVKHGRLGVPWSAAERERQQERPRRQSAPQRITRIPPFRPGDSIVVRDPEGRPTVRTVRSLSCCLTAGNLDHPAPWYVTCAEDGRTVPVARVLRPATEAEASARRVLS